MNPAHPIASEQLRIVSLLPSATEMACALGLEKELVAVSHCCDYPATIAGKPRVVHSHIRVDDLSLKQIDAAVSECLREGRSLYEVDAALLRQLAPTLMLTQDLCEVCAPARKEVQRALEALDPIPQVLCLSPRSIEQIFESLRELGLATGKLTVADALIASSRARLQRLAAQTSQASRRVSVFCADWIDPVYCSGHWVPEMVELAGGIDVLGRKWADSGRVTWDEIVAAAPEVVVVMPCGYCLGCSGPQAGRLLEHPAAAALPALRYGRVYAVDGAYFNRPTLRVVEGAELLAHLLHPELCLWQGPRDAFRQIFPRAEKDAGEPPKCARPCHDSIRRNSMLKMGNSCSTNPCKRQVPSPKAW